MRRRTRGQALVEAALVLPLMLLLALGVVVLARLADAVAGVDGATAADRISTRRGSPGTGANESSTSACPAARTEPDRAKPPVVSVTEPPSSE